MSKILTSIFYGMVLFFMSFQTMNGQGNGSFSVTTVVGEDVLNFGTFTSGTSAGEITVDINGIYFPTPTGGIQTLPFAQPSAVTLEVNTPNNSKPITISPVSTTLNSPGGNIVLELIYSSDSFIATGDPVIIKVGGKLTIPQGISEGLYSGSIVIPVTLHNN